MKMNRPLIGLIVLFAVVVVWKLAIAAPKSDVAIPRVEPQRYAVASNGAETVLLDTATGETWRLACEESDSSQNYWARIPAPGGIARHRWGASPFTEVRFRGNDINDAVEVEFRSKQYELVSINGFSTRTLLEQARHHGGSQPFKWQKYFVEDLSPLLIEMGQPAGETVSLILKDTTNDSLITIDRAPMTKDNRQEVWHRRNQ